MLTAEEKARQAQRDFSTGCMAAAFMVVMLGIGAFQMYLNWQSWTKTANRVKEPWER